MLFVEDWAEIRRLHRAEQMPIKAIARVLGVSMALSRSTGPSVSEVLGPTHQLLAVPSIDG